MRIAPMAGQTFRGGILCPTFGARDTAAIPATKWFLLVTMLLRLESVDARLGPLPALLALGLGLARAAAQSCGSRALDAVLGFAVGAEQAALGEYLPALGARVGLRGLSFHRGFGGIGHLG